jgi:hypothetical protein
MVRHVIALASLAMMHTEDLLEGCRHMLEPMKAVGDLRGRGSPLPHAGGISFGAVTGDNLDAGMGLEPRGDGFSGAIFQHVKGTAPSELDKDGAVAMACAPRPVVDANDFRCRPPGQRHTAPTPKQGMATLW